MTELLDDRLPPQNIEAEQAVLGAVLRVVRYHIASKMRQLKK
ncbi:hypothetical protein RF262_02925 [Bacillus zhangzhouensis]|nr:hypothetical protein [Bacillus zhangzhouensis]MDR0124230.1 hypothetical protein [Bacillus zhangzhouensis]